MTATGSILPSVLANTQTPHQPFLLLQDSATCSGIPVLRQLIKSNRDNGSPIVLVSILHTPEFLGLAETAGSSSFKVLDLTNQVPGFPTSTAPTKNLAEIKSWITTACKELGRGVQVYIDDVDVLAEDYGSLSAVVKMVKDIIRDLSGLKAPSRLILLSSTSSQLLPDLLSSSISPSLTSVTIHPPEIVSSLHSAYLFPPPISGDLSEAGTTGGSRFRGILENATKRNENLRLALTGELGASVGDWSGNQGSKVGGNQAGSNSSGEASSSSTSIGVVAEVLVRKAAGGASKGMLRSLEGLRPSIKGKERANVGMEGELEACRWQEIKGLELLAQGYQAVAVQASAEDDKKKKQEDGKSQAHVDTTFNLGLTDSQRASRAEVPIPYAHEGDDAPSNKPAQSGGGIFFEPGSDDDMDDDDPDDDLDF